MARKGGRPLLVDPVKGHLEGLLASPDVNSEDVLASDDEVEDGVAEL